MDKYLRGDQIKKAETEIISFRFTIQSEEIRIFFP